MFQLVWPQARFIWVKKYTQAVSEPSMLIWHRELPQLTHTHTHKDTVSLSQLLSLSLPLSENLIVPSEALIWKQSMNFIAIISGSWAITYDCNLVGLETVYPYWQGSPPKENSPSAETEAISFLSTMHLCQHILLPTDVFTTAQCSF